MFSWRSRETSKTSILCSFYSLFLCVVSYLAKGNKSEWHTKIENRKKRIMQPLPGQFQHNKTTSILPQFEIIFSLSFSCILAFYHWIALLLYFDVLSSRLLSSSVSYSILRLSLSFLGIAHRNSYHKKNESKKTHTTKWKQNQKKKWINHKFCCMGFWFLCGII